MTLHLAVHLKSGNSATMRLTNYSLKTLWYVRPVLPISILFMWMVMPSCIVTSQLESKLSDSFFGIK